MSAATRRAARLSWCPGRKGKCGTILWYNKGKNNAKASAERKRMMYVVGVAVELETALRAVGKATEKKAYAIKMAKRAAAARKKAAAVATALPDVAEFSDIVKAGNSAGLKLNNDAALSAAADKIATQILSLVENHDGSKLAAVDGLIPGPDKYKGKPAK